MGKRPFEGINQRNIRNSTWRVEKTYTGLTSYRVVRTSDHLYGVQVKYPDSHWQNLGHNGSHGFTHDFEEQCIRAHSMFMKQGDRKVKV